MKMLAISPRIPEEGKKGDQVLSFNRLSYLARNHHIYLICFGDSERDFEAKLKLESVGISVELIRWSNLSAVFNILRYALDTNTPLQCALFESVAFQKAVQSAIVEFKPVVIYAVTIRALGNIFSYRVPLFVDLIDSMALNFSRRVSMASGLKRFVLNLEYQRLKYYEKKIAQLARCSFVVSAIDQKVIGSEKVKVLPLGVEGRIFFKNSDARLTPIVIFTGNMNYKPNVDAILWFYRYCWDELKLSMPGIQLVIAGGNPASAVVALRADKTVTVTGRVPSLATVINTARVSIAPMQSGSGMQFKILEAMACGVPVVSTTLGLGDIGAKIGSDLLLADTADSFIKSVLSLLQSDELRTKIGNAGWKYVNEHHTWDAVNADFEKSILSTLTTINSC
jgi:glycosyltransferase involved in cell wall biosynthesis